MFQKSKIKVLHFLEMGSIGGKEKAIYQLLKAFKNDEDFEFALAVGYPSGYYFDKIRELSIDIINLDIAHWYNFRIRPKILGYIRKFDAHHFHDSSPEYILLSLLAGRRIKRILTRRGGIKDHKKIGLNYLIKYHINKILIRNFFEGYSGNTRQAAKFVRDYYKIKDREIFVIYNGVDFNLLKPKTEKRQILDALHANIADFKIGTACHLIKLKRVDLIIKQFARCNIENKKLYIFGTGKELGKLKKLAYLLNLENKVSFVGELPNLYDYLNVLDCFVLASGKEESFGNVLVEAMYLKVPCIIMDDSDGLKEHIIEAKTGFIAKNELDLAAKIEYVYHNPAFAKEIAKNASNYVLNKYSINNMINQYKNFYFNVLKV